MPATRQPGIASWIDYARASMDHHDSLEGLLRHPLSVTAVMAAAFGNPRRGQLVYEDTATGEMRPFVAATISSVTSTQAPGAASDGIDGKAVYAVEFFSDVAVGDTVKVIDNAGALTAGTVEARQYRVENAHTGLVEQEASITVNFGDTTAAPANAEVIIFSAADGKTVAGVVVESTREDEFGLGVEVDGALPEKVAGGTNAWVQALAGITKRSGLLFIRTV